MVIMMKKKGFASMYLVYSFFLVFIIMMLSVLLINSYKRSFLNALKNDIKEEIQKFHIDVLDNSILNQLENAE